MSPRFSYFVVCAPGAEPVLHAEIRELKFARAERQVGGVLFSGTIEDGWRANLYLRTAVRVLLRLSRFEAADADALYRGVSSIDWTRFVLPDGSLVVDAQTSQSSLDHSQFVAQRCKDAIVDQLRQKCGRRPFVDKRNPDLRVHAHIYRDRVTLSVDTSGDSLHKRGWRCYQGRAPLAENLAAVVLAMSGWDRRAPLIDPFCGSGTFLVEAAMLAMGLPAGAMRPQFGFERWPLHDASRFAPLREQAQRIPEFPRKLRLIGNDISPNQIEGARENLASIGAEDVVEFRVGDAAEMSMRSGWNAWIVTNPPYGERVGDVSELTEVYARFGEMLRTVCGGYSLSLMSGSPELGHALGFPQAERTVLKNGGLDCDLIQTTVPHR
ncbi:MAG: THUMP domain-containing protein [Planctomycetota bacterium]|jgi:23S rRNA G2445 N2-methylase RlmL|nr:THUMP domain-containing protein [Planctomycetota bacterium]